jgi:hypothetical protein
MIPDPHARRFDPRWLFPGIGTDGAELFRAPEASPRFAAETSTNDRAGLEFDEALEQFDEALEQFDEALEQVASDGCRVCPLCGSTVGRTNSFES